jgi:tRNA G10  N-methylase Trm11
LLGFDKVIGFDQSAKAVKDTEQNLSWLRDKYGVNIDKVEIEQVDVRQLSKKLAGQQVDVIVTEPDLGSARLQVKQVDQEKQRLEKLYSQAGQEFFKVLRSGGRVVMVWPIFFGKTYLDIEQKIKRIGFIKIKPIDDNLNQTYPLNSRGNLEYHRSGQRVGREITVWTKSN